MTLRPRAVRAVMQARANLRDLAAADEARASAASAAARTAAERASGELDQAIGAASTRLATSGSIAELQRISDELEADKHAARDAERVRAVAATALEGAIANLRQRERQLRTVERALEQMLEHRADGMARDEQRLNDDLNGRRREP